MGTEQFNVWAETPTTNIRRNYMSRTYSGANLLHSSGKNHTVKAVHQYSDNLMWYRPRVVKFPPLKYLDKTIELKLIDIIMGDDPLNEGLDVEHDEKKREQLAQKNLKFALWNAGRKRVLLREKY